MPLRPDYLVIGHITKDLDNGGYTIGGTATYSALTAHNLGCRAGIISSTGPDIDLSQIPPAILVELRSSEVSTTFQNTYRNGHRQQHIGSQAAVLTSRDIPDQWKSSPIVHLGPIAQEIDDSVADSFPEALLGLTPQGWLRSWDEQGIVCPVPWEPSPKLLQRADAVILSREDVGDNEERVEKYAAGTRVLVLTAGWKGATVYHQGQVRSFPAPQVIESDPTGAGDIFATAFLVAFHKTGDPYLSAQFANCVAAHSVERSGLASIPTHVEISRCRKRFRYPI
jgi:sugar/nucleoside kinase (ribokinase family)